MPSSNEKNIFQASRSSRMLKELKSRINWQIVPRHAELR